ncbi:metal-dependent hydrolase family protein [Vibrio metschnikovii]|uniref:metal-dependent hydrolase family protein n=1 Tax=Vibrio metschnikovii TaxID=28172 RepID=UPI001C2FF3B9|nr:amidohydrolase family protein [Vibrio metschnikovii]
MNKPFWLLLGASVLATPAFAAQYVFKNVQVFDGRQATLSAAKNVYVQDNLISKIEDYQALNVTDPNTIVIDGQGKTLMPGLIDAHTHLMLAALPQQTLMLADQGFINIVAAKTAADMLQRGYTSVRDLGGPIFGLKMAIDKQITTGPRIWPAGAFISQTGGHGDFRLPNELITPDSKKRTVSVTSGTSAIADSPDEVRQHVREQLALGASQIKLMAGGGASSFYDPIDVTQYSVAEIRAATEAAENWGTYVTVHAYTPRSINQAIDGGVKSIEHGQLIDEKTAKRMAKEGIWWSLQPFTSERKSSFAEGSPQRLKQKMVEQGTDRAYRLAKKHQVKVAWGTDILFSAEKLKGQTQLLSIMTRWYTPAEVLKMATYDNSQLLMLSGERAPYQGKLGVIEAGALADLLIVNGNPLQDLTILEATDNLQLIMKDGRIYKNTL